MGEVAELREVVTEAEARGDGVYVRWSFGLGFSDGADATWHSDWTGEPVDLADGRVELDGLFEVAHFALVYDLRENGYTLAVADGVTFGARGDSAHAERVLAMATELGPELL